MLLPLFHFHYSLLLLLLVTCHLSPHQRHSRFYNVTRLLYTLCQSLTLFSIVLTKTCAVETSTFLSVFYYMIAQKFAQSCPVLEVNTLYHSRGQLPISIISCIARPLRNGIAYLAHNPFFNTRYCPCFVRPTYLQHTILA